MSKIKLILQRISHDPISTWTEFKEVEMVIPLKEQDNWQVVGAIWSGEKGDEAENGIQRNNQKKY